MRIGLFAVFPLTDRIIHPLVPNPLPNMNIKKLKKINKLYKKKKIQARVKLTNIQNSFLLHTRNKSTPALRTVAQKGSWGSLINVCSQNKIPCGTGRFLLSFLFLHIISISFITNLYHFKIFRLPVAHRIRFMFIWFGWVASNWRLLVAASMLLLLLFSHYKGRGG